MSRLTFWLLVGFLGQALFTARFVVQWLISERKRDSVVPVAFWWLSLLGGGALLIYAVSRQDPVIIVGQAMGLLVYVRNLMLVSKVRHQRGRCATGWDHDGDIDLVNPPQAARLRSVVKRVSPPV
jgi:lipid-A-disaccharide synthase-like uncharacterized protein